MNNDTQEKINNDVKKGLTGYWGCKDIVCDECQGNARTGYKRPNEYYRVEFCSYAMTMDLLRRQRELDTASSEDTEEKVKGLCKQNSDLEEHRVPLWMKTMTVNLEFTFEGDSDDIGCKATVECEGPGSGDGRQA